MYVLQYYLHSIRTHGHLPCNCLQKNSFIPFPLRDIFWCICSRQLLKTSNFIKQAISPFATIFSTVFNQDILMNSGLPYFYQMADLLYTCGIGLSKMNMIDNYSTLSYICRSISLFLIWSPFSVFAANKFENSAWIGDILHLQLPLLLSQYFLLLLKLIPTFFQDFQQIFLNLFPLTYTLWRICSR